MTSLNELRVKGIENVGVNVSDRESSRGTAKRREYLKHSGKSFDEHLESAMKAMRFKSESDVVWNFDDFGTSIELLNYLSELPIESRIENIERAYSNTELELSLGVSPTVYRDKYFNLLMVVALSIKTE